LVNKKPLPAGRHQTANGFANAWYIKPEDNFWLSDYEIIIEFIPQRVFSWGLKLSLLTLVICLLGWLGCYWFCRRKVILNKKER
jgi:hypothetical protein